MSELVELGVADGDSRWIGIRRHQAVLVVVGLTMVGDFTVRSQSSPLEGPLGIALCLAAIPMFDALTGAQWLRISVGYLCRQHWFTVTVRQVDRDVALRAGVEQRFQLFALHHRGRLDLSGDDQVLAMALRRFTDGLATRERVQHFSLHTSSGERESTTYLVLPAGVRAPEGWRAQNAEELGCAGALEVGVPAVLVERLRYVRDSDGLARVVRIRDFSAAPEGRALLEAIQGFDGQLDVALHVDVLASSRAHHVAARAVHRGGSDDATSQAAGFRRSARSDRSLQRLRQRESLVAGGRALLRLGVYVVVRASSIEELQINLTNFYRVAHESGLRCDRGFGQQARWYHYQLPGGLHW